MRDLTIDDIKVLGVDKKGTYPEIEREFDKLYIEHMLKSLKKE